MGPTTTTSVCGGTDVRGGTITTVNNGTVSQQDLSFYKELVGIHGSITVPISSMREEGDSELQKRWRPKPS
jgi:hypothetical protein